MEPFTQQSPNVVRTEGLLQPEEIGSESKQGATWLPQDGRPQESRVWTTDGQLQLLGRR